jgi:hypothetical protein
MIKIWHFNSKSMNRVNKILRNRFNNDYCLNYDHSYLSILDNSK